MDDVAFFEYQDRLYAFLCELDELCNRHKFDIGRAPITSISDGERRIVSWWPVVVVVVE
jgi:hypothetical protein